MKTFEEIIFELTSEYMPQYEAAELACMIAGEIKKYFKYIFLTGMIVSAFSLVIILKWLS